MEHKGILGMYGEKSGACGPERDYWDLTLSWGTIGSWRLLGDKITFEGSSNRAAAQAPVKDPIPLHIWAVLIGICGLKLNKYNFKRWPEFGR